MSRRRSRTSLEVLIEADHAQWEANQYWGTLPHPEPIPEDWMAAWAETTLDVVQRVWASQSRRLYSIHRDAMLRDDLHSWLLVEAQEAGRLYTPNPLAQDPEYYYGAWLWRTLNERARWHFQKAVGKHEEAVEAHRRGVGSIEGLIEAYGGDFFAPRHALHAQSMEYRDPAIVIIAIEDIERRVAEVEHFEAHPPTTGAWESVTPVCQVLGCDKPRHGRFTMCKSHYDQDRWLWRKESAETCSIPECDRPLMSMGLCGAHKRKYYSGTLEPEYHQYVVQPVKEEKTCIVEDCDTPAKSRGLCAAHYHKWKRGRLDIEVPPPKTKGRWG